LPFQAPYKAALPVFPKSPHSPIVGAPSLEEQLRAASASPSVATQTLPFVDLAPQSDTINVTRPSPFSQGVLPSSRAAPSTLEEGGVAKASNNAQGPPGSNRTDILAVQDERVKDVVATETPAVDPKAIEPPLEEPQSAAASPSSATTYRPRAPQVVHLPPKDTQEARLLGTEQKLDKAVDKQRKEEERLAIPPSNGATDLVSSPSSTVGAYSQATPHAPHHSPDTSPETDPYHERTQAHESVDNGVDSAAQQIEEDHERSLRAQMKEAKEMARVMSSPTPEIERQIEDEQAIRLARDGKPDLGSSRHGLLQQAGQVASEITLKNQLNVEAIIATADDPAADSLPTPTTTAPEPSTLDLQTIEEPTRTTEEAQTHPTPPADTDADMNEAPGLLEQQGPQRSSPRTERMATQISSSAMRAKPVAEIIEGKLTPKSVISPRSGNISASISPPRPKTRRLKPDEVATVIFAKKSPSRSSKTLQAYNEDYASLQGASEDSSRDYLEGLFKFQSHHPPRSIPLQELVASAQKTLSTAGSLAMIREHQDYKILKRVYQLQNANRWSLRQIHKAVEPERQFTHHDQLLLDMKWMQTDFREERKWKKSLAATFAEWCAEYVNSNPEDQVVLRVNACVPQVAKARNDNDEDMHDAPTPDLLYSHAHETESDSYADEDELRTPLNATPPAGIFSLGFDDVVMKIDRTSASDTLFRELPFYEPMLEGSSDGNPFSLAQPPILPVSKYVTGKLVSQIRGPPRKRSRYDYDSEDEPSTPPSRSGTSAEHSMPSTPGRRLFCRNDLPPEMNDVALFNTDNKHVRDRLQAAHSFRPPTEFNMPTVAFFENRIPSQWLWEEDQKLRALVKEFTFNWSLVSQQLALPSMFVSGSGRRTPWECFERWVSLEGLPAEMSKTQYFRTYQGRLESANKTVFAQYQAQQQQQQGQQGTTGQPRRRPTTVPIRVERRRENRHLAIIDGMRKLARKRESAAHKQAESQKAAALRKAHEPATPKANVHTPQEFSRLKWEREEKLKMKLQQQQQEMAARVSCCDSI
jgi:chromatin modification-related protein VID21